MNRGRRAWLFSLPLVAGLLVVVGGPAWGAPGPPKPTYPTPTISCAGSTPTSITLEVCGGPVYGAPAGVTIQWMTKAEYDLYGWDGNPDSPQSTFCDLSLSGKPSGGCDSRWDLAPGGCEQITIHASTVEDEPCGAGSNCISDLLCGTTYVFRVRAHGDNDGFSSPQGPDPPLECSTQPCAPDGECTRTWGYWKTHGPAGCNPSGGLNVWPVTSLTIGALPLSDAALCAILQQSPKACAKGGGPNAGANAVLILEHQLIAAMLNRAAGAVVCDFANAAIDQANALLAGNEYACVGASTALGQNMLAVKDILALYNDHQCSCPVPQGAAQAVPDGVSDTRPSSWGKVKVIYR